jgi:hypothetical protein
LAANLLFDRLANGDIDMEVPEQGGNNNQGGNNQQGRQGGQGGQGGQGNNEDDDDNLFN